MHVFVNPDCDFGRGRPKWMKIESALRRLYGNFKSEYVESPGSLPARVQAALARGERVFIAAGGDGTVHCLLNALLNTALFDLRTILGAVGLGSSNDFHKPFRPESFIQNAPVRMDWEHPVSSDVIAIRYQNARGEFLTRYCLINASMGIAAEANALYNSGTSFIVGAKRVSHDLAVIVSALRTVARYKNIPAALSLDGQPGYSFLVTNLGVIKNPHFAGQLCYDTAIRQDDGRIGVNLCAGMTKSEAVRALIRLYRRNFGGRPKTHTWLARRMTLETRDPFALEMDGEVVKTNSVVFNVLPRKVRCCS